MFMENGFDGFISKPIDIRQLNATLNKLIRGRYPPEVVEAARQQVARLNMAKSAAGDVQPASDTELAAIFTRESEKAIETLDEIHSNAYGRADDIRMFIINVHALKSALANIGETGLSAAAFKLEQAGRAGDVTMIMSETPAFLEALREVIKKNKPKEDYAGAAKEDLEYDRAYLGEKMSAVKKACGEYDEKTANMALAELRQKEFPHSIRELLDAIAGHLLHSDFEEAAKLAEDYTKNNGRLP
jgi:HPt (histidine-containing phosphotransfer) domain-containing protein